VFARAFEWFLDLFCSERSDIKRPGKPTYLTRWSFFGRRDSPGRHLFIHRFRQSDEPVLHNHPWPFWSLILWPGYWEFTPIEDSPTQKGDHILYDPESHRYFRKHWYGPLRLLRRPADWFHRVELAPGRECWSLIWTGRKQQSWGFACKEGFMPSRRYVANLEAGGTGCGG
jgi:hypothetical protein